jgi:hypothetical protein
VGVGQWGEMTQALYVHMNNKRKKKELKCLFSDLKLLHTSKSLGFSSFG